MTKCICQIPSLADARSNPIRYVVIRAGCAHHGRVQSPMLWDQFPPGTPEQRFTPSTWYGHQRLRAPQSQWHASRGVDQQLQMEVSDLIDAAGYGLVMGVLASSLTQLATGENGDELPDQWRGRLLQMAVMLQAHVAPLTELDADLVTVVFTEVADGGEGTEEDEDGQQ